MTSPPVAMSSRELSSNSACAIKSMRSRRRSIAPSIGEAGEFSAQFVQGALLILRRVHALPQLSCFGFAVGTGCAFAPSHDRLDI
jgi:hypothetical protein